MSVVVLPIKDAREMTDWVGRVVVLASRVGRPGLRSSSVGSSMITVTLSHRHCRPAIWSADVTSGESE